MKIPAQSLWLPIRAGKLWLFDIIHYICRIQSSSRMAVRFIIPTMRREWNWGQNISPWSRVWQIPSLWRLVRFVRWRSRKPFRSWPPALGVASRYVGLAASVRACKKKRIEFRVKIHIVHSTIRIVNNLQRKSILCEWRRMNKKRKEWI